MLITEVQKITSKKGDEYTIVRGVSENGSTIEAFLNDKQASEFKVSDLPKLTSDELAEIFKSFKPVDIDFDQRGRCVGISA